MFPFLLQAVGRRLDDGFFTQCHFNLAFSFFMKAPKDFFRPMRDNGGPSHSNSLLSSYKALLVNVYYKLVQIPITECADHIIPRFLPLICTCDKSTLFYCNNNWLFPLASPLFCLLLSRLLGLSSCPPISTIIPMSFAHFFGA